MFSKANDLDVEEYIQQKPKHPQYSQFKERRDTPLHKKEKKRKKSVVEERRLQT